MPDKRRHRGPHPDDTKLFSPSALPDLQAAVTDYSLLLSRDYATSSALKLVGDRFHLTKRQREAVQRCSCSEAARKTRAGTRLALPLSSGMSLELDGYNVLITVESALSRGLIFQGRDGCYRDLASIHGTYRSVDETVPALSHVGEALAEFHSGPVTWYLDAPVSNSGRLAELIRGIATKNAWNWQTEVVPDPDRTLVETGTVVASADSWILDRCEAWVNLARRVIEKSVPQARVIDLSGGDCPR